MRRSPLLVVALAALGAVTAGPSAAALPGPDAVPAPTVLVGDSAPDREFGWEVAADGDTAITTSTCRSPADECPAIFVFVRSEQGWSQQARIAISPDLGFEKASLTPHYQWGDNGVALSGDTIAVSVRSHSTSLDEESFSIRVFVRNGSSWTQQARIANPDPGPSADFGYTMSLDADTLAVGGLHSTADDPYNRAAYVFVRSGAAWSQQAVLECVKCGGFYTMDLHDETLLVGAKYQDSPRQQSAGAVHVYDRSGTTWRHTAQLKVADADAHTFGSSVAFDGETAVISAPAPRKRDVDQVYVFARAGTAWERRARFDEPQVDDSQSFGSSLDVSGDTVVVGAEWTTLPTNGLGAAYVYARRDGNSWGSVGRLTAPDFVGRFGTNVAADGDTLVVGTLGYDRETGGEIRIYEGSTPAG